MAEILTFLTLIPEIRDQIYEHVLSSPISPPKSPSASGPRILLHSTYYPLQPFPWPGASLVRTCQQVRTEVSALAQVIENRNRAKKRMVYQLDIMIIREGALYPTWVNLLSASPAEQQPVYQIWANLRTIDDVDPSTRRVGRSSWTHHNVWSSTVVWNLFAILNRFFVCGLSFETACLSNRKGHPGKINLGMKVPYLEELVLNVVTLTEEEMEGRRVLRPEKMVEILEGFIKCLQDPAASAGKCAIQYSLFEKLGKIRLCLDGKEVGSWRFSPHLGC